jgi:hypothetical protein
VCDALTQDPRNGSGQLFCGTDAADDTLICAGGGICASPDTRIATANGEVPIAALAAGDLVYSQDGDATVLVPLLAATRRPVFDHRVVELTLDDGTKLEVSGPHPTADGRRLDELRVGDAVDGRTVVSTRFIPYAHEHTYDILPASGTGRYLANGVWLGTTLGRGP